MSVVHELFQRHDVHLFGSVQERISLWKEVHKTVSLKFSSLFNVVQLIVQYSIWKEQIKYMY